MLVERPAISLASIPTSGEIDLADLQANRLRLVQMRDESNGTFLVDFLNLPDVFMAVAAARLYCTAYKLLALYL
jgi:hypothetical protein